MSKVLVVGGAGYIGSHMVLMLSEAGHDVVVMDNLSSGYRNAVIAGQFVQIDLADVNSLQDLFSKHSFDGVMHFAAHIEVGESVANPSKYYRNNVTNTQNLLDIMCKFDVKAFIFSSTAAIFGEPQYSPIDEVHPRMPINPYGRSKWMVEQMLEDYDRAYGLKSVALRYFNAAGADPEGRLGERHDPESHLIPLVLQAASGRRGHINVFGNDYDTPDGTCLRDYIHIIDLCDAHMRALNTLIEGGESARYNLGNGQGFSVQEVIDSVKNVTGRDFKVVHAERRAGDPARLVADSNLAHSDLQWKPQFADLATIIAHAWQWELNHFIRQAER